MTEITWCDVHAKKNKERNAEQTKYTFRPLRLGETFRVCPTCGAKFEPASRTQKYCCRKCRPRY